MWEWIWLVDFNNIINEYHSHFYVISDASICKIYINKFGNTPDIALKFHT